MANLVPKYKLGEAISVAIALGTRAIEEIRTLARTPGPKGDPGLGFDDLDFVQVDERNFELRFTRGTAVKTFKIEMGPPYSLVRQGWKKDTVKIGDKVTVEGACLAKNGSDAAGSEQTTRMVLASGQKLAMR